MEFVPAHFFSPFFSRCQRRFMKIQNITTTAGSDCRRRLVKQRKVWEELVGNRRFSVSLHSA